MQSMYRKYLLWLDGLTCRQLPFYQETMRADAGTACLRMIFKYYGKNVAIEVLNEKSGVDYHKGVSLLALTKTATEIGFRNMGVKISFQQLRYQAPLPCIVHWNNNYFIIVYRCSSKWVYIIRPDYGKMLLTHAEFCNGWLPRDKNEGICLLIEKNNSI